jgi:hypothetical protein
MHPFENPRARRQFATKAVMFKPVQMFRTLVEILDDSMFWFVQHACVWTARKILLASLKVASSL